MTTHAAHMNRAMADVVVAAYKEERLTQARLVEMTGISPTTMQRILAGTRDMDLEQLALLSAAVKVPADDLLRRAMARAEKLASESVSEGAAHNVTDLREWSAEQLDNSTEAKAASPYDPESDTDEHHD